MKHTPYYFQTEAVNAFIEYYNSPESGHGLIVLPTGTGKSLVQAMIADEFTKRYPKKRILFLTHVPKLLEQNFNELIVNLGIIDAGIYCSKFNSRDTENHILFASIQSVFKKAKEIGRFGLIVIDEAHSISPNDETMYRKFFVEMIEQSSGCKIIGLTATPYRMGTGLLTEGENKIFEDIIYEYPLYKAIKEGYVCKPIGRTGITRPDTSHVKKRGGEYIESELAKVCDDSIIIEKAVTEIIGLTKDREHILIFCVGIKHSEHVAEEMQKHGVMCKAIHSGLSELEQKQIDNDFKNGVIRYVCNVDMWTTGYNFRSIDCIVMLRPTMSTGLYYQMCLDLETEILTERGFLRYNEITENDVPFTYNIEKKIIEKDKIKNIIYRDLEKKENFYSFDGHANFRITNEHDLLVRSRRKNKYKKEKIQDTIKRKDFVELPVAGIEKSNGTNLTNYEIEFLGWFLSDGSLNKKNNAITISQSESNMNYILEIENCIKKIGLKYGKHIIKRNNGYSNQIHFTISKGKPRGRDSHLKGWFESNLKNFIDKNLNEYYELFTKDELIILIESLFKGDGCNKKNREYNVKTKIITMGDNKIYAEKMQSLLIRRGFKCNLKKVKYKSDWNKNPKDQYILYIKNIEYITIAGCNIKNGKIQNKKEYKRTRIEKENFIKEKVWCIETNNQTIITRRNGKPLIMGNCGRGFRLHENKKDFLLLDYAGNILTHGPLDKIYVETKGYKKNRGVQTAPMKECKGCGQAIFLSIMICPECGYEYPVNLNHGDTASDASPISKYVPPEEVELNPDDTNFYLHESKNGKLSMRVSYTLGALQSVSEYICIEHGGYAEQMARKWLKQSLPSGYPIPDTVEECLQLKDIYKKPCSIFIDYNQRFPRVISRIFPDIPEEKKEEEIIISKRFIR